MRKVRTTVTLDADVIRAVKLRAASKGCRESEIIEEALRRELGVGLMAKLWEKSTLTEEDAARLALEAQHGTRAGRGSRHS